MGINGFSRGIFALAVMALLMTPGVVAETPQVVTLDSTVTDSSWPTSESSDVYSELAYAESSDDWAVQSIAVPESDQSESYWVAESGKSDYIEESVAADAKSGLGITVDMTWVSKYLFRGIDILDDSGAYQPSVEISLWDSGITVGYWGSYASGSRGTDAEPFDGFSRRDLDEHDYYAYYGCSPIEGVDLEIGWIYYDFIHLTDDYDYHEPYGTVTLSGLPLSPYFGAYYGFPGDSSNGISGEGWNTTFGLSHSFEMGCLSFCGSDPLSLDLSWEIWHQGGQYDLPTGWTHQIFGMATTIPICKNMEFTPGVYWQDTLDNSAGRGVNDEDEWWASLSLTYTH